MTTKKQNPDQEEDEEDDRDDCVDDMYHDSDFPLFELPPGELNRNSI